ncbi:polysaccharide deacetylase family protein [Algoriphagus aestuariicola]|uniref:Polysaccharide deacetylase family protein n=1 Tax=Algoriphagus aestuariicola TaxID=1852016 RepID=A0ABS3BNL1_9BACT|nr:polysaccharide deacetylase family protein [Algoriphagus aestuariicola]MBN7800602.1 polysaccharide deacetylase family protein [Algoriphagus aestuariicola]
MKATTQVLFSIRSLLALSTLLFTASALQAQTYAEKLGWPKDKKVVIFHVDDAGMSRESNAGTFRSLAGGIATSCSVMMPCPWAGTFMRESKDKGPIDAGLHLVLTSEWKGYRWEPLAGKSLVPGLHDPEGSFWPTVEQVVAHASPEEVYIELKAQIERALSMGIRPTHLDSHMGTVFAHPKFLEKYIQLGAEYEIPVMFPGGNNVLLEECQQAPIIKKLKAEGKYTEGMELPKIEILEQAPAIGRQVWAMGLPVLDDLHTMSGEWRPEVADFSPKEHAEYKVVQFKRILDKMQPGLAMIIIHSTMHTENFDTISASGKSRQADLDAMLSSDLQAFIEQEGIILTTWREVMERRKKINE